MMNSEVTTISEPTMTSLQIAEVVESRHDSVKRAIERIAERGVIDVPPLVEDQIETSHGRKHTVSVYHVCKRDSYVVVAQLSPEFTARLVDRWQELEQRHALEQAQLPNFTNQAVAARAWADEREKAVQEEARAQALLEDKTKAEAERDEHAQQAEDFAATFMQVIESGETHAITEAAKVLKVKPKALFDYMGGNGWIFRESPGAPWKAYQKQIDNGRLWVRMGEYNKPDGTIGMRQQVRVTGKGLMRLSFELRRAGMDQVPALEPQQKQLSFQPEQITLNITFRDWVDAQATGREAIAKLFGISRTHLIHLYQGERHPGHGLMSIIQHRTRGAVPVESWFEDRHPDDDETVVEISTHRVH